MRKRSFRILQLLAFMLLLPLFYACDLIGDAPKTVRLTYDANPPTGESISDAPLPFVAIRGKSVTVANKPTLENYDFLEWNTSPDGSGDYYREGDKITASRDMTLYAQWVGSLSKLDVQTAVKLIARAKEGESISFGVGGNLSSEEVKNLADAIKKMPSSASLELDLPDLETVPQDAFKDASTLKSVTLDSVKTINANAFGSGLDTLYINSDTPPSVNGSLPNSVKILVPEEKIAQYQSSSQFNGADVSVLKNVTVTLKLSGAGTKDVSTKYEGLLGSPLVIDTPKHPSNYVFVKWVNTNDGSDFTQNKFPSANAEYNLTATWKTASGYPIYPAHLTRKYESYEAAEAVSIGDKTDDATGKTYSQALATIPKVDDPERVKVGTEDGLHGSYRIPALTKVTKADGKTRIIAAFDIRYRGQADGNGDAGAMDSCGSDTYIMYSDDGGSTWNKTIIDVPNSFGEGDTSKNFSTAYTPTVEEDLGDPNLFVTKENGQEVVYMIATGGGGILGAKNNNIVSTCRIFRSTDYGATWTDHDPVQKAASTSTAAIHNTFIWDKWGSKFMTNRTHLRALLGDPGHGIVLKKDVPYVSTQAFGPLTKDMTVVPMQGRQTNGNATFGVFLVWGNGDPKNWTDEGAAGSISLGGEEGQICQLDDGSLLLTYKINQASSVARVTLDGKYSGNDAWNGRGQSQTSILKVKDGANGKNGIVAHCSPASGGDSTKTNVSLDAGRNKVTVSFAADISGKNPVTTGNNRNTSGLSSKRYYLQIRDKGQRYFGYTDMVMVDDDTIGIIYECRWTPGTALDGMRFVLIDVSEIIKELETLNS